MNYESIKEAAKERGCRVTDLVALAPKNDPFYVGTPGDIEKARWFEGLWRRFGYSGGVHLRRVHYQLISQDPPLARADGAAYENTEKDWNYLGEASKVARYMGLVEPEAFVDRRNPEAIINARFYGQGEPELWISGEWTGDLQIRMPQLPSISIDGYRANYQPYMLEVWVEKTTMNDVLEPLCSRFGANLVTGAGELSITATVDLIKRVQAAGRPCRIFYVSDYDPAGYGMPVSVARKVEFLIDDAGLDVDIRLEPVALTREQVQAYKLPRTPIKAGERRAGAWRDVHGAGAVELDALEALHSGSLARIVEDAMLQYWDPDVEERAREQRRALQEHVDEAQAEALADLQEDIDGLAVDFESAVEQLQERIRELGAEMVERLKQARESIDLENYPEPEGALVWEHDGALFDSGRSYFEQLAYYTAHQEGGNNGH